MDEYYKKLPKKRMAAGALIFNKEGELLLVKISYKDYWSIPGGVIEENESPKEGCVREVREEIGLELKETRFLCVDYTGADDGKNKDESLQFIFSGGQLTDKETKNIKIDEKEITEYRFIAPEKAFELLGGPSRSLVRRLPACLEALGQNKGIYLEDGLLV
jgi:ADP-ribose pyrophosphatase YjhB (NUDIX family)